jgi:hypothetical protein
MWKAGAFKVVALPVKDRWVGPPRASIERTDYMLVFMGPVSLVVGCQ